MKTFIVIGAAAMALGVILGAFGAHGLKARISPEMLAIYHTGVEYHFYNALGLLLVGLIGLHFPQAGGLKTGGWLLTGGILIFSGSLYVLAVTGIRWLGAITPIGGVSFIAGWCWIAWSLIRA